MEQLSKSDKRMERIKRRNEAIKLEYEKLSAIRVGLARKYSDDAMFVIIADKFFLSEKTVEDILCNRTTYQKRDEQKND
jgi:hypothetical protein